MNAIGLTPAALSVGPTADAANPDDTIVVATPDLAGRLVGKRFTARYLESRADAAIRICNVVFGWGVGHELLDGFDAVGWERGYGDFIARPDPATLRPLAWWPGTSIVLADALDGERRELPFAPRAILRRQVARAAELGFDVVAASELEFTIFDESPAALVEKAYTNLTLAHPVLHPELVETIGLHEGFLGALRRQLEASGIRVESVKAEYSPSQVELVLEPAAALEMADRHTIYKLGVREIARQHGLAASFMAKWHHKSGGSSCHVHLSLVDESEQNAFAEGDDSSLRHFVAGLERYARDVFLLWAPYPNSYKRFRAGSFAPASIASGSDNRTAAFRVAGAEGGRHIENRVPGADVNPYLAYAATLAAGLAGLAERLEPAPLLGEANAYARSGLPPLPSDPAEAIRSFTSSDFARGAFGGDVVDHLANFSQKELDACRVAVTDWDRRRLFDI